MWLAGAEGVVSGGGCYFTGSLGVGRRPLRDVRFSPSVALRNSRTAFPLDHRHLSVAIRFALLWR